MVKFRLMLWLRRMPQFAKAYKEMMDHDKAKKSFVFGKCEWLLLTAAVLTAVLYVLLHPSFLLGNHNFGGAGVFCSLLIVLGAGAGFSAMKGNLKKTLKPWTIALLAATVLLGLSYLLYSNQILRRVNFIPLVVMTFACLRALTRESDEQPFSADALWEGCSRFLTGIFRYAFVPFRALGALRKKPQKKATDWDVSHQKIPGLLVILILLIAVIGSILLGLAIPGFSAKSAEMMGQLKIRHVAAVIGLVLTALIQFSLMYASTHPRTDPDPVMKLRASGGIFAAGWILMIAGAAGLLAYCLEGNNPQNTFNTAMLGGFALMALIFNGLMLSMSQPSRVVQLIAALGTAAGIGFGIFSVIRFLNNPSLTIPSILMFLLTPVVVILLIMQLIRLVVPRIRICHWAVIFLLFGWALVNLLNLSGLLGTIAVEVSQSEKQPVDARILATLGPDAYGATENISDAEAKKKAQTEFANYLSTRRPVLYDWGLGWGNAELQSVLPPLPEGYVLPQDNQETINEWITNRLKPFFEIKKALEDVSSLAANGKELSEEEYYSQLDKLYNSLTSNETLTKIVNLIMGVDDFSDVQLPAEQKDPALPAGEAESPAGTESSETGPAAEGAPESPAEPAAGEAADVTAAPLPGQTTESASETAAP